MKRLGDEIARELARGGSRDAIPLAAVTAAWPEVVGDGIARQAWPLRIARDGTLHVATASATWANELAFLAEEILERLRARLGPEAPARIKCAAGPIPESAAPVETRGATPPTPPEVPDEIAAEADSAAAAIADPELRELVARAARRSLLRARSDRQF